MSQEAELGGQHCPLPRTDSSRVLLGHGSGGRMSADLLQAVFLPRFSNDILSALEDQATLNWPGPAATSPAGAPRLAFTTDAFVVKPLFFPGGDIGRLAVFGTVNDLAVGGAVPQYLSAAFILEEGLPLDVLHRVVASMQQACAASGVQLVAGDTKVVDRGKADQVFITTTGIGIVPAGRQLSVRAAQPGDRVLLSGTLGDHGMAVMSVREGLEFETELLSDAAPLHDLTQRILATCSGVRCMRDPTRGGLASALNELAAASRVGVRIDERSLPVRTEVRAACELLGLDPLYVANEGKLIAVVPEADADRLLDAVRAHPMGVRAAIIGQVVADHPGVVVLRTRIGGERIVSLLAGEQLPRIC
ncbi:MAG: hydrogenase expression/formation protein HypE [Pirellulaceae bacterium]